MTDDKVSEMAYEVDDFISLMLIKHRLDPLTMGSIIMARLMLANQYVGSGNEFRQLMLNIPEVKQREAESVH